MSLDSVELLITFENYFDIRIPDIESEKISTVQDMADSACRHLHITNSDYSLRETIFEKLSLALRSEGLLSSSMNYTDPIFTLLDPDNADLWKAVSQQLNLCLPLPYRPDEDTTKNLFRYFTWTSNYNWKTISVEHFITAVCAENYEKILAKNHLKSTYEVLIAVIAITTDKLGLDVYEVRADKSFTNDFGVD